VLHYVRTTQKIEALHIDSLKFQDHSTALELDQVTVRNLELVEPLFAGQDARATLFHTLDACQTPMGKRLLRPRFAAIGGCAGFGGALRGCCRGARDLLKREECGGRLAEFWIWNGCWHGYHSTQRDRAMCGRWRRAWGNCRVENRAGFNAVSAMERIGVRLDVLEDLTMLIETTLVAEPPLTLVDGGAIANSVDQELDELRTISSTGRRSIAAIEERERQRRGLVAQGSI